MPQPIQQFYTIQGHRLYTEMFLSDPTLPTIVFLHDSLGCVATWRDFPYRFSENYPCNIFIYDRTGYGHSSPMPNHERANDYMTTEAHLLMELLQSAGIQKPILFGHSDGGTIALLAASIYPSHILSVICEAGHVIVEDITLAGIREAEKTFKETDLPLRLAKYHGDKVDSLFKAWTQTWLRPSYRQWNILEELKSVTCPILFIQGALDEFGSNHQIELTLQHVQGPKESFLLPNTGHSPHKTHPDEVLEKSVGFLNQYLSIL